jgi:hypothetical protein
MTSRRDFLKGATVATLLVGATRGANGAENSRTEGPQLPTNPREYWVAIASRLATPVLEALAEGKLKERMPVEAKVPADREPFTHLEAVGRLLAGLAPWLEGEGGSVAEQAARTRFAGLARRGIAALVDPGSPNRVDFSRRGQTLVDAAFLAQALLRAPNALWGQLDPATRSRLLAALAETRATTPPETNWVLFASMVEAAQLQFGGVPNRERLEHGLKQHQRWYVGDGMYGDGAEFHWDYYNAFVIQPMLVETLDVVARAEPAWVDFRAQAVRRLTRFAAIQERLVAPDGTYPVIGRSATYRCGAFQGLAFAAWRELLPPTMAPAQARVALTRVIQRTLEPPGTFDRAGWLQIGVSGHQPSLGETYISTGSLYLCATALLPLGFGPDHAFWTTSDALTTSEEIWRGVDLPADHALM